jgi:hypothetical protein
MSIPKIVKMEVEELAWVNLSELSKEELMQKDIFERFMKTGEVTDEDWKFCEEIDWHPVDELPLKESFIKELKRREKEPCGKPMTAEEFKKWCDKL